MYSHHHGIACITCRHDIAHHPSGSLCRNILVLLMWATARSSGDHLQNPAHLSPADIEWLGLYLSNERPQQLGRHVLASNIFQLLANSATCHAVRRPLLALLHLHAPAAPPCMILHDGRSVMKLCRAGSWNLNPSNGTDVLEQALRSHLRTCCGFQDFKLRGEQDGVEHHDCHVVLSLW